ncbi:MAG TPA: hypothetical protein VGS21_07770 [Acidimicrobiales bacterium]|nr:hypothetical protein [Acidimicrobiales bacterium]
MNDPIEVLPHILAELPGPDAAVVDSIRAELGLLAEAEKASGAHPGRPRLRVLGGGPALMGGAQGRSVVRKTLIVAVAAAVVAAAIVIPLRGRGSSTTPPSGRVGGGKWTTLVPGTASEISAYSCVSTSWCVLSRLTRGATPTTQFYLWRGGAATPMTLDAPLRTDGTVEDMTCLSEQFCAAVGEVGTTGGLNGATPMFATYDGRVWTTAYGSAAEGNLVPSVSCVSADYCLAVVSSIDGSASFGAETWDGQRWSSKEYVVGTHLEVSPRGVACISPSDCVVVGGENTAASTYPRAMTIQLVGNTVTSMPNELSGKKDVTLTKVVCIAADDCLAAGNAPPGPDGNTNYAAVERFDGRLWTEIAHSSVMAQGSYAFGFPPGEMSCFGAGSCLLVGGRAIGTRYVPFAQSLEGSELKNVSTPSLPPADSGIVESPECLGQTTCVAVFTGFPSSSPRSQTWSLDLWRG